MKLHTWSQKTITVIFKHPCSSSCGIVGGKQRKKMMMMGKKKPPVPSISTTSSQLDPLLRDLSEKKQIFRRSVLSLTSELRDVRNKLVQREDCLTKLTVAKQEAETKAKILDDQISLLKTSLEERDEYLQKLEAMNNMINISQAAHNQCLDVYVLHRKEDEERLKYVDGIEKEIAHVSSNKHLSSGVDDGIARLRAETGFLSEEMQSQVEEHRTRDEELKTRIFKLELSVQDARRRIKAQKLRRVGQKRDRALKKIKDEMEVMRQRQQHNNNIIGNVLESCCLGMIASISMLAILVFASK